MTINEPKLIKESKDYYDKFFLINPEEVGSNGVLLDIDTQSNIFNLVQNDDGSSVSGQSNNVSDFFNRAKVNALTKENKSQMGGDYDYMYMGYSPVKR